eukprot:scaffold24349_cov111-Isochrysis_galbana.AAC.3
MKPSEAGGAPFLAIPASTLVTTRCCATSAMSGIPCAKLHLSPCMQCPLCTQYLHSRVLALLGRGLGGGLGRERTSLCTHPGSFVAAAAGAAAQLAPPGPEAAAACTGGGASAARSAATACATACASCVGSARRGSTCSKGRSMSMPVILAGSGTPGSCTTAASLSSAPPKAAAVSAAGGGDGCGGAGAGAAAVGAGLLVGGWAVGGD